MWDHVFMPNRMQILVLRLCLATPTWQSITGTSSPSDRYGLNAAAMTDGSVVFLGGPDSSTSGSTWHLSLRNQSAAVWNKLPDPPYSVSLLPSWNTHETPQHPTFRANSCCKSPDVNKIQPSTRQLV